MYKVRFHIGAGRHFRHWQIKGPEGVRYVDPETHSIVLTGCTLRNRRGVAEKVLKDQKRDVCGHVLCESVEVLEGVPEPVGRVVHFDPKVVPFWTVEGEVGSMDGRKIRRLASSGRRLRAETESDMFLEKETRDVRISGST